MRQGKAVTDQAVNRLIEALRIGMTRRAACGVAGFSATTLYRMMGNDDGTLVAAMEKAEAEAEATYSTIVANAAADPKNWTAAAWWLERRHPSDYAKRERVEMTGKDGGPIDYHELGTLPDHERAALAEAIRSHLRGEAEPAPDAAPAGAD